jgi:ribosomal protein S21
MVNFTGNMAMGIEVRKKEGETASSLLFRFTKKVRQSGVLAEARKRRFKDRRINRNKRRVSAIYRAAKRAEMERLKKLGLL